LERCAPEASLVAAKYEALRVAALGQALPLEARSGLALLLRRGMWSWARALATAAAAEQPSCSTSPRSMAPCRHNALIQILAAMAMNANNDRSAA
jgi:hypothetical protein